MHQKVVKLIAVICSTASLYLFIGMTAGPKSYHNYRYAKTLFIVNPESESDSDSVIAYEEDNCCPQLSTTVQAVTTEKTEETQRAQPYPTTIHQTVSSISATIGMISGEERHESSRQLTSSADNSLVNRTVDDYHLNCDIHLAMIFAITHLNESQDSRPSSKTIESKLFRSLTSISKHINHKTHRICVHLITDKMSGIRAKQVIRRVSDHKPSPGMRFYFHEISEINAIIDELLPTLKKHFNYRPNSYYSHSLFFTSLAVHHYFTSIDKLIFLDIDIQFSDNLTELFQQFGQFGSEALIGIAHEQQPVYLHILHEYRTRTDNKTDLGAPPPKGWPGFNSGVLLLNLKRMRASKTYQSLLKPNKIDDICKKYSFSGHLGDQDFYTVVSFEYRHLFHVLPCNWNRQLCQWWRYHGYRDVFDQYYACDLKIKLFHGNCNSRLPSMQSL